MAKKKFRYYIDHPCILHVYKQDGTECLDKIKWLKKIDGEYFYGGGYRYSDTFTDKVLEVFNAINQSGKFRKDHSGELEYEIYDAIHHDDELVSILKKEGSNNGNEESL